VFGLTASTAIEQPSGESMSAILWAVVERYLSVSDRERDGWTNKQNCYTRLSISRLACSWACGGAIKCCRVMDRWHPVSTKTAVFFIRRSTRSCCQTAYYWTLRLPCRRRSHMERLIPADVTSAPSLFTSRKRLKLHLFRLSYPGLVLWINVSLCGLCGMQLVT